MRGALRDAGATLIGAGIHPDGAVRRRRARRRARATRRSRTRCAGCMRRTPTCALHVHVGMPDPETAIGACNGLRALPPGAAGRWPPTRRSGTACDSGFATARAQLFRGLPAGRDPAARSRAGRTTPLRRGAPSRPPTRPTTRTCGGTCGRTRGSARVEVRAMDAQVAARVGRGPRRARARARARRAHDGRGDPPAPASEIVESSFRAGRDGLDATICVARRDAPAARARPPRRSPWRARTRATRRRGRARGGRADPARRQRRRPRCAPPRARAGCPRVLERLVAETAGV